MCKITTIDVGMCLPKCFVTVVNLFTFLLGFLIFAASIFGLTSVKSMLESGFLNFLFYGPIAFGSTVLFISLFGCCGACFKSRCMLMTFAIMLLIIFACQVGVVYYVYDLYARFSKAVDEFLMDTIMSTKDSEIFFYIWQLIQYFFGCCGVISLNDWKVVNETLPTSCCPRRNETVMIDETSQNVTCTQANAFENGCKTLMTDYIDEFSHPVTVGVIVVLTIQLINLILSCCMFFVYGWQRNNYRKANSGSLVFVDKSPAKIHDHFIVKTDRF